MCIRDRAGEDAKFGANVYEWKLNNVSQYSHLLSNPDYKDILELQKKFSHIKENVEYILAIGGGSVTDTAKAIAAFRDKQEYLTDFVRNKKNPKVENPIKIIAVPTTSGTSSELTCWATIWDKEKNNKLSLAHKTLYAEKAIIDPSIMIDKPVSYTHLTLPTTPYV